MRPTFPNNRATVAPWLPKPAKEPPGGPDWIHEMAFASWPTGKAAPSGLISRNGHRALPARRRSCRSAPVRSCVIDAEAIVCGVKRFSDRLAGLQDELGA